MAFCGVVTRKRIATMQGQAAATRSATVLSSSSWGGKVNPLSSESR